MQFRHPEILYALFFLILPLIVHLFQLRKFRKEKFTNVKFLKRLTEQTRKSSKLKKWLVLLTRMFLLAAIIFAFAQPHFPTEEAPDPENSETVIYLDNSYSMQAQGQNGRLLDRSIQELLEQLPEEGQFTLITNSEEYAPVTRNDLQQIEYSPAPLNLETLLLRVDQKFSGNRSGKKNLLLISDFQEQLNAGNIPEDLEVYALPRKAERLGNIKIDTAFISFRGTGNQVLTVQVSQNDEGETTVPVSLYNGEDLLGKSSIDLNNSIPQQLEFPLEEGKIIKGRITIEDSGLQFDNNLYFSVNQFEPLEVVSLNVTEGNFLNRIFTLPDFSFTSMPAGSINYNLLASAQVVILNEVDEIPSSLVTNLQEKLGENPVFIVIPSAEDPGPNFRSFIRDLGFPGFGSKVEQEKLITGIAYNSPLFSNVFEEETRNFEYPKVQVSYNLTSASSPLLAYQDQKPFLTESNGHYLFTAPLSQEFSNFTVSPLVVPTFYNMGTSALQPPRLYYNLGRSNRIDVPVSGQEDDVLQIASEETNFIPLQQNSPNRVRITLEDLPEKPGNYRIFADKEPIMGLSFNVPRQESESINVNFSEAENIIQISELSAFFTSAGFNKEESTLWKWFVIFALILLLIETLLLKYLK